MTEAELRTRRHEQGERSREEILDAASQLMSAKGFSGTSISDLARESGLTASSIYWHFESKAGVLAAVMERGAGRFFDEIVTSPPATLTDPAARLRRVMEHSDRTVREHPDFLRLFMLLLLGSEGGPSHEAVVDRVRSAGRAHLHSALLHAYEPWGDELAAKVADELVDVLFALFDGVFIAGQTRVPHRQTQLVDHLVASIHALALSLRDHGDPTAVATS